MNTAEKTRFDRLYRRHLRALKLQGMSESTIDVYARAVRRIAHYYDCCPDRLSTEQLQAYFAAWSNPTPGAPSRSIVTACNSSGNTFSNATGSGLR